MNIPQQDLRILEEDIESMLGDALPANRRWEFELNRPVCVFEIGDIRCMIYRVMVSDIWTVTCGNSAAQLSAGDPNVKELFRQIIGRIESRKKFDDLTYVDPRFK
jgi:hypothetical protein